MKLIELKDVTKYYSNVSVGIEDCSLEIQAGKIYGLVGPNGSGKSTILKILNGLLPIDKGTIKYFEQTNNISKFRNLFGYVPDTETVWKSLTAKEFVIYINQLFQNKIDDIFQDKFKILLELFDLEKRKNDLLENYSFGMKKKIQIIATILHEPLILSIDEPMFGLDPEAILILMELLNYYIKNHIKKIKIQDKTKMVKPSIILATHQLEYAERYSSEFFLLSKNRVKLSGKKEEIYSSLNVTNLNTAFIRSSGREEIISNKIEMIKNLY